MVEETIEEEIQIKYDKIIRAIIILFREEEFTLEENKLLMPLQMKKLIE